LGPQLFRLVLPVFFIVCAIGVSVAVAGEESTTPGNYVQIRVGTYEPPVVTPGDDDQPTIGSRKRGSQVYVAASPENRSSLGNAGTKASGTGMSWIQSIRWWMGRLGVLLLRMPS